MKTKHTLTIAAAFVVLMVVTILGIFRETKPVQAQDTVAYTITHLNVPEKNVVNLVGLPYSNLREVGRDGLTATTDYIVPEGMVLVITDITWSVQWDENTLVPIWVALLPEGGGLRKILREEVRTDRHGLARTEDHFTAGLILGPGNRVQVQSDVGASIRTFVNGYTVARSD